jgi:polyisoprenoid-binding protein YceI
MGKFTVWPRQRHADSNPMQNGSAKTLRALPDLRAWKIDASESAAGFEVRHFRFATVAGRFGALTGDLGPWGAAGSVEVASVDSGSDIRDARLRAEFFDAERFPRISFETDEPLGPTVTGRLTIRDVTRPIAFTVASADDGDALRLTAHATISRKAFGLDWAALRDAGRLIVSDRVRLRLELVARPA